MQHQEAVETMATERYLLGEMDAREQEAFEAHFFSCSLCADDIRAAATMREGVRAGFVKTQETSLIGAARSSEKRRWRPEVMIPWAAAASLALLTGYQSVRPSEGQGIGAGPVALAPVTLRSATRGQQAVVAPGPSGVLTLAVDLGGERYEKGIHYELRGTDGSKVAEGEAPTQTPGAPLLLILPAGLVKASGQYILQVRETGTVGLTPEEYRFSVEPR